ncbi:serine hydrolase [Patescibacteria group bacterium]|nr:serine hydrolase [Patescibacteria group bacterium]
MITKLLGQFVVATLVMQMLPSDVSFFEWQTGVGSENYILASEMIFPTAKERPETLYPVKKVIDSYGIVTTAESALVIDRDSGMMLLGKRPDDLRSIGSVTKLMTAIVFLDQNPDLTEMVELDPVLDLIEGGRIYLAFYDPIMLEDVFGASIVGSDNTATESLMRFSGLSSEEFVEKMNQKAAELGMASTSFIDPTGINSYNMSTARDLVKLLEASEAYPVLQKYMTTQRLAVHHESGRVIEIENTNGVLETFLNDGEYQVTAGKTGYLPQAGYVLATAVKRAENEIYVVVLGSESIAAREDEVKGLAAWVFKVFQWPS